ncbi:MAG: hypothetical protein MAGBODY4_00468 [Candidatus Marinimicrobia bacterium]|nr:hypothetical protein [Candidatus Neomarinimicrobiota bacterium]
MLIPKDSPWAVMEQSLDYISDDFMDERNQSEAQPRDDLE